MITKTAKSIGSISTSSIRFDSSGRSRSISNYGFEQKTSNTMTPGCNPDSFVRETMAKGNQSMNFSKSTAISIWSLIAVQPNYHQQTQMRLMTNGTPTARSGLHDCA